MLFMLFACRVPVPHIAASRSVPGEVAIRFQPTQPPTPASTFLAVFPLHVMTRDGTSAHPWITRNGQTHLRPRIPPYLVRMQGLVQLGTNLMQAGRGNNLLTGLSLNMDCCVVKYGVLVRVAGLSPCPVEYQAAPNATPPRPHRIIRGYQVRHFRVCYPKVFVDPISQQMSRA